MNKIISNKMLSYGILICYYKNALDQETIDKYLANPQSFEDDTMSTMVTVMREEIYNTYQALLKERDNNTHSVVEHIVSTVHGKLQKDWSSDDRSRFIVDNILEKLSENSTNNE